jgi:GT2 family glycosyltransferase
VVAVIVAAYNAERTIDDCIRSLLALRYPSELLELRVVDNGSHDGTATTLRHYEGQITVLSERERGAGAARNTGLRGSDAEVVAFTDADCVVDPEWLSQLVAPLTDPRVAIAGGTIKALPPASAVERYGELIHDHQRAIEEFEPPYAITMNWASRSDVMRSLGGFDNTFRRGQDVDLSYRAVQAGYRLAFAPGAVVYHRNERNLGGLFREGFMHGFHGVRVGKRHDAFLRGLGQRGGKARGYQQLRTELLRWLRGESDLKSRCDTAFKSGKKAGKLVGSARFRCRDL